MQREKAVMTNADKNQFDNVERLQFEEMSERRRPNVKLPSYSVSENQDRPFRHHQYRHSGSTDRHHQSGNPKFRKPKSSATPCMKFLSSYGCSYGDKCRFSHDVRALYPVYYESTYYENPIWSTIYRPNYPQRQMPLPKISSPMFRNHLPPARERAVSFANHFDSRDSRFDSAPVSPNEKPLFKEVVLKQCKVKQSERKHHDRSTHTNTSDDDSNRSNQEIAPFGLATANSPLSRQYQRCKTGFRPRKSPSANAMFNPSHDVCYPYHGSGKVGDEAERAPQQFRHQEQQMYPPRTRSTTLVHPMSPLDAHYLAEEQFQCNLSRQIEAFVDFIDTKLASMERHQHQAIDAMQDVVRSLWPDAFIDVYGSSYTRLALPVSDIDCVLVCKSLVGEQPLTILEALAAEVERQSWTRKLELLGNAKIPVLKATTSFDPTQPNVLLDLTCGHSVGHTGLDARDLIFSLQAEMPALRPLVLILKSHLVSKDLNCAFTGGISSYVLVILVIRFLQACGDSHFRSFAVSTSRKVRGGNRRRSYSDNSLTRDIPEEFAYLSSLADTMVPPTWCFTFFRGGRVTWCTGIGSLLLLFLETYITFDYRRFGISIDDEGEFFLLPPDKTVSIQCSVVIPYVADPIKSGRSICNCFRMHEVIQAWLALYQNLVAGVPVATCVGESLTP